MNAIAEARTLTATLRQKRGTIIGIACKAGNFAVTETRKVGGKSVTEYLSGFQSYADCLTCMRTLAA